MTRGKITSIKVQATGCLCPYVLLSINFKVLDIQVTHQKTNRYTSTIMPLFSERYIVVTRNKYNNAWGYDIKSKEDIDKYDPSRYIIRTIPDFKPSPKTVPAHKREKDIWDLFWLKTPPHEFFCLKPTDPEPNVPWWGLKVDFTGLNIGNSYRRKTGRLNKVYLDKLMIPKDMKGKGKEQVDRNNLPVVRVSFHDQEAEGSKTNED
ncbi:hypothetical protein QBC38DRAFT_286120 [Podospora fimiseda]|uniref:Uncharacterized protein n=1 Tax=Podospora fimiseda TaxID=252190 RepID=A0AAN7GY06_9PEZI|nr:hypothetical protein QBC38DRAFT_286120 [Podospora fimiseda]